MNSTEALKQHIMCLVRERGPEKTICPSEAARAHNSNNWRPLMDATRQAARELQQAGKITVEQQGQPVAIAEANGPIRLRLSDESPQQ